VAQGSERPVARPRGEKPRSDHFGLPGGSNGSQITWIFSIARPRPAAACSDRHTPAAFSHVLSFKSRLQFDDFPEWAAVRALPIEEQRKAFSDPEQRKRLVAATKSGKYRTGGGEPRKPQYENMYVMVQRGVRKIPPLPSLRRAQCGSRWR